MIKVLFATLCVLVLVIGLSQVRIHGQTYCPSSCQGDLGCNLSEAMETDWCQYPTTGCNSPTWTNINGCCYSTSPLIVDLSGQGFSLTSAANGVPFDFFGLGSKNNISWTAQSAQNAWLVLDRDGNGMIDTGKEMFGNLTPQPPGPVASRNGFRALAEYDAPQNGGDGNGWIDQHDAVFSNLRLWTDRNHNGISESEELIRLVDAGVSAISLEYKESRYVDQYGNRFRYKAHIKVSGEAELGGQIYDVFLLRQP